MPTLIEQLAQEAQDAAVENWSAPEGLRTPMRVFVEQALTQYANSPQHIAYDQLKTASDYLPECSRSLKATV